MFTFGQLSVDMIRANIRVLVNPETSKLQIPKMLLHIINIYLSPSYEERYNSVVVGVILDELTSKLSKEGKTEFVEEDMLPQLLPQRHLSSWDIITS
jgi:hypothetical protein